MKIKIFIGMMLILKSCLIFSQSSIIGFGANKVTQQKNLEAEFDRMLLADNLDGWMKLMSAEPHYLGTAYGRKNVEWMVKQFKSWGYDAKIETYQVLFPYPIVRLLELVAPEKYKAKLTAVPVAGDTYTDQGDALLPSYNAFSSDGDVTSELVFVNYGIPEDYDELEKLGVDVKGKIVIVKYYGSWRGIKPKLAAEKGAIGCIIYSDPKDDGFYAGDVYPKGAFKNATGVQRGSVMDMPLYPGDVLTPGYGATKNAKRLDWKDAPTITKIPVLPISYEDALPLLANLEGQVAPPSWRGALPITYHIGPGPARVHLKLTFDWQLKNAHNVIAKLKGKDFPDQWIIRGNHHDAWVHGAADPLSGMVALLEEARVVGMLAKAGNEPKRTLIYCAWDAEEPGLIGSTEWVEDHLDELQQKTVAYINTDGNGRGFLGAGGSHSLESMVKEVAIDVIDPQKGVSVAERLGALDLLNGGDGNPGFYALGSGSDYTPFIQHAGIAAINIGFGGENLGGEYHTIYDTYKHFKRFKDPDMSYGIALAKTVGRIVLRLANAEVLPFEFEAWYMTVQGYLSEINDLLNTMRAEVELHNAFIDKKVFFLTADPKKPFKQPSKKAIIPYVDFSPLHNALASLKVTVDALGEKSLVSLISKDVLNDKLMHAEEVLTFASGLPRRSWYRHQIYAPGFYTGYGVKTLPGVREAIEQENWEECRSQVTILTTTLQNFDAHLQSILVLN